MGMTLLVVTTESYATPTSQMEAPTVRSHVAKILLSTLGGAALGMSTLSFYERPQDHLSNVAVGGALGAVFGSIYVTRESLKHGSKYAINGMSELTQRGRYQEGSQWALNLQPDKGFYGGFWYTTF